MKRNETQPKTGDNMPIINTVTATTAEEGGKELMDLVASKAGEIAKPLELIGVSSILSKIRATQIMLYATSNLSQTLMTTIRFLSAERCGSGGCVVFNGNALKKSEGLTDSDLAALKNDPNLAPLNDREKKLLAFADTAVKNPDWASQKDIDALRELGWSDNDILEATYQATDMAVIATLMHIFKVSTPD